MEAKDKSTVTNLGNADVLPNPGGPEKTKKISSTPENEGKKDKKKSIKKKQPELKRKKIQKNKKNIRLPLNATNLIIPRLPFQRIVREIMRDKCILTTDPRIQSAAVEILQAASEMYLVHLFKNSYLHTLAVNRMTLTIKDMQFVRLLQGRDVLNY